MEELQAILASEGLFNFRITGYFGAITKQAVKDFQKKYGIAQVGQVGPLTLAKIRSLQTIADIALEDDASGQGKKACLPPGKLIAPGQAKRGLPNLPSCKNPLPAGIAKIIAAGGPGKSGGSGSSDTTAPVISGVSATNITATSSVIVWQTDELSNSTVWYGTTTPVVPASPTASVSDSTLVTSHSLTLSGLTSSTTYYFIAQSADQAGNTATSSENSFMTLGQ